MRSMRVVTVKMPKEMVEELDLWARLLGKTRSELLRKAVEYYLRLLRAELPPPPKRVELET